MSNRLGAILSAQRDRFRKRIGELEAERELSLRSAATQHAAHAQLQKDNLALYERIRYLQSYGGDAGGGGGGGARGGHGGGHGGYGGHGGDTAASGSSSAAAEAKYRSVYEARMDPFAAFSSAERARRYTQLSVAEKITLNTARMFLASKEGRTLLFCYLTLMHFVVFCSTYYVAHKHDDCHPAITAH